MRLWAHLEPRGSVMNSRRLIGCPLSRAAPHPITSLNDCSILDHSRIGRRRQKRDPTTRSIPAGRPARKAVAADSSVQRTLPNSHKRSWLCENSEFEFAGRNFVSISSIIEHTALATDLGEDNREKNSARSSRAHVFTQPRSKASSRGGHCGRACSRVCGLVLKRSAT